MPIFRGLRVYLSGFSTGAPRSCESPRISLGVSPIIRPDGRVNDEVSRKPEWRRRVTVIVGSLSSLSPRLPLLRSSPERSRFADLSSPPVTESETFRARGTWRDRQSLPFFSFFCFLFSSFHRATVKGCDRFGGSGEINRAEVSFTRGKAVRRLAPDLDAVSTRALFRAARLHLLRFFFFFFQSSSSDKTWSVKYEEYGLSGNQEGTISARASRANERRD